MKRIVVCNSQVPFVDGGAEILADGLRRALLRRGYDVATARLPLAVEPRIEVIRSALAWRLTDLVKIPGRPMPIDAAICLKYPSYVLRHPCKIVWLVHQYRQVYELLGTRYSDLGDSVDDQAFIEMVRRLDTQSLGEARALYTISRNVAERLERYNGLRATPLYHPPQYEDRYRCEGYGDTIFTVSRQDPLKRVDLLIKAMPFTRSGIRAVIAGVGPELEANKALAARLGVAERIEFVGYVDEAQLIDLYSRALAVYYAPFDEDYGYVTLEAFLSGKAVVTARDSGGTLEFVKDGETGLVFDAQEPASLAAALDRLMTTTGQAQALGEAGYRAAVGITWDRVVDALTEPIP